MPTTKKGKTSGNQYFLRVIIIVTIISLIPIIRQILFPDQITRVYKALLHSPIGDCDFTVQRIDKRLLLINFKIDSEKILRTEIYKGDLRELEDPPNQFGQGRYFFAHSINFNAEGVVYLTRTLIATDADMKHIQGIEASVCDRLLDESGHVDYLGYEPIIKCVDPLKTIVCTTLE